MSKSRATAGSLRHCFSLCASSVLSALCSDALCFVLCSVLCAVYCEFCSVQLAMFIFLGDSTLLELHLDVDCMLFSNCALESLFQILSLVFCAGLLLSSITCTICNLFLVQPCIFFRLSVFLCASYSAQGLSHCW